METQLTELGLLILAAFVGSWLTYRFENRLRGNERRVRRYELLRQVGHELKAIPDQIPTYVPGGAIFFDAIQLATLPLLIDGVTLNFAHDTPIIIALMNLQIEVNKHNDIAETVRLVQVRWVGNEKAVDHAVHKFMFDMVTNRRASVIAEKAKVLAAIGQVPRARDSWLTGLLLVLALFGVAVGAALFGLLR